MTSMEYISNIVISYYYNKYIIQHLLKYIFTIFSYFIKQSLWSIPQHKIYIPTTMHIPTILQLRRNVLNSDWLI